MLAQGKGLELTCNRVSIITTCRSFFCGGWGRGGGGKKMHIDDLYEEMFRGVLDNQLVGQQERSAHQLMIIAQFGC